MTRATQYRIFWFELGTMLESGLPLLRALNVIIAQSNNSDMFTKALRKICGDIQAAEKKTFSQAMADSGIFSSAEITAVKAGEVIGNLETICYRIASGKIPSRADQFCTFYKALSGLTTSGVPILQTLRICQEGLDQPFKDVVQKIYDSIAQGDTIAATMDESRFFSALECNIVDVGEETGCFDQMVYRLAKLSEPIDLFSKL